MRADIKILIGCEESQTICNAFRNLGFDAYSCDLLECSGGHPEWHIQGDVLETIRRGGYKLLIGHPPCTYLSNAGNKYFNIEAFGYKALNRWLNRIKGADFFMKMFNSDIPHIALENPVGFLNGPLGIKPTQIIEPFYFGDNDRKRTCLWLKNLPKLEHTKNTNLFFEVTHLPPPDPIYIEKSGKKRYFSDATGGYHGEGNSTLKRSKTFPGIATAMAEQWGNFLLEKYQVIENLN